MRLAILSHPDCTLHKLGKTHPEIPERVKVIQDAIQIAPFYNNVDVITAPLVQKKQLYRAHDKSQVDYLFLNSPTAGTFIIDHDTEMTPYTLQAAKRASGAVVKAVSLVLKNEYQQVFCNIRPPGHHASRNNAQGFCFFNNIAVGALHALEHENINRVAIIDFDVHHGNGTEDIFAKDNRVKFFSSFEYPLYPNQAPHNRFANINHSALKSGDNIEKIKKQFKEKWLKELEEYQPDLIFISAGFDAHKKDPYSTTQFESEDYHWMTKQIMTVANKVCGGRVISSLEGGYDLQALKESAIAHVQALMELPLDLKFLKKNSSAPALIQSPAPVIFSQALILDKADAGPSGIKPRRSERIRKKSHR
tara:strand:+ start:4029 stop:5117 length:1089 start_codon:yes stop_codon:yes gene_type:complete